tara:strand:+ start:50 stop:1492 length:1443 start_codon:yes stop_codon:yes gene_type:complete
MSQNYAVGEFVVEAFTLINQYNESLEITNMVMGFKLYESIFNKFVTGEVSVADGLNLPKNFRLTGQEYIRISIKQKEGNDEEAEEAFSIDKTFRIYKLDNIIRVDEITQSYVLRICDPRMFYARKKKISQTLRGRYDQILQNALIDVGKFQVEEFDAWEQTKPDNKQLICPNWSVAQLTDYIVNNSQVGESHAFKNDMFFYQTLNGGFRFQSFDSMCTQEFPIPFSNIPRNTSQTEDENLNAPLGLNSAILVYKKPQMFDTLQGTVGGAYASTLKVYDPIRKLEEENVYDLESAMKKGNHVSGHPMLYVDDLERVLTAGEVTEMTTSPEVSETDVDIQPTQEFGGVIINDYHNQHSFDNATSLSDPEVFESRKLNDSGVLERRALLDILQQHRIQVTIPLRTDLSVGMIIKFVMTTPETMGEGDKADKVNDDRYLITDLAVEGDTVSKTGTCILECVKESYAQKIETAKPLDEVSEAEQI